MIGWMFFLYQQLDIDEQKKSQITRKTFLVAVAIAVAISAFIYRECDTPVTSIVTFNVSDFSSKGAIGLRHFPSFARHLLDAGANIQYAPSDGPRADVVLVGRS